jgi:hypothetical protein
MGSCSTELTPPDEAPDLARKHIEAVLTERGCGGTTVATVQRIVMDLLESDLRPAGPMASLTVRLDGRDLLIEVEDEARGDPAALLDGGFPTADLASGWGVSPFLDGRHRPGRIVWLRIPRDRV